ncbi:flagellar export protein FliJ [Pyruvatibacter sp.]|uniref:flagellar export protein FliJ n=1 Tax=unclassified Pyruvatibacter TaxID=2618840 RepID=UPI002967E421|nr:flagellar export protein FliJ [Alphaproteobacteria bacterium]
MKSRTSLIRVQRFQVEEIQRRVADLEQMLDDFRREEEELEKRVRYEQKKAGISDEAHYAYPTYAKYASMRRDNLAQSISELSRQVDAEREKLTEAFEDLKKVELVDESARSRAKAETRRREQADLDEIAINMHGRGAAEIG